jgi:hypothetical protein
MNDKKRIKNKAKIIFFVEDIFEFVYCNNSYSLLKIIELKKVFFSNLSKPFSLK